LQASELVADRRLQPASGGDPRAADAVDELLDPQHPLAVGVLDHQGRLSASPEEAEVVARLVQRLVERHGYAHGQIAVIAPFRAQNALIESLLGERAQLLTIDTVDRVQGQEREVVIVSLCASDPDYLVRSAEFFYSPNRINVAISRAKVKCIVLGSRSVFRGRSLELAHLEAMSMFSRIHRRWHRVALAVSANGAAGADVAAPAAVEAEG
jgi:DNA replication ATP-dependent helicase Dna2